MDQNKQSILKEFEQINKELSSSGIAQDPEKLKNLSQRRSELEEIVSLIQEIEKTKEIIKGNEDLIENLKYDDEKEDQELEKIAQMEIEEAQKHLKKLNKKYDLLTVPKDPLDKRDVILEIRAGAGGDEAGLFAWDLFRMYSRYCENKGFRFSIINSNKNEVGGLKEMIVQIEGQEVFGDLKYESGVHRVQRIPETEKSGRIHTSTATVAVIPKALERDIEIKNEEIKIDTFRSSGPGGQSVNTTDSAIRITHLPSGLVVSCQDEKSQHKNKAKALSVLRSRLLQHQREQEQKKVADLRSSQIGTGDRSEKIRTYNFPQDRITDHRTKTSWHGIERILDGALGEIIESIKKQDLKLKMEKNKI
ncbi:MAG: peptide chain release factor 1 [Candidatus Moranbacteria bacterium]|nr:peptide chain release factor 1 [Candidatus Moranbacteria bacterium]